MSSAVGVLGTDSVTRSHENLLAKCYGLIEDGLTAYIYTGSYAVPPPTITGRVMRDVCLIDRVLGVGEAGTPPCSLCQLTDPAHSTHEPDLSPAMST